MMRQPSMRTRPAAKVVDVQASLKEWDGNWASHSKPHRPGWPSDYAKFQDDNGYIKKNLTQDDLFDLTLYQK